MRELLKQCASFISANCQGEEARKLVINIDRKLKTEFPVSVVSREDLEEKGFLTEDVDADILKSIASYMDRAYQDYGSYSQDLSEACWYFDIPQKDEQDEEKEEELGVRRCTHCRKPMKEGWLWGDEYYCSEECLNACNTPEEQDRYMYCLEEGETLADLTEEEREERFDKLNDSFFYTEWESIYFE